MQRITRSSIAAALTLMLAFATVAMSAPKSEKSSKRIKLEGRVLQINNEARTLLVSEFWTKKLYLVTVPKGESFRITFGVYMGTPQAELWQVRRNDRVRMECIRNSNNEHLSRLADGREVITVTATH